MESIAKLEGSFPVVCVGGSAGGLDGFTRLLTCLPVALITERLIIQPKHVFIIPEQRDLHVMDGQFHLAPISKPRGWPDVITAFLTPEEIATELVRIARASV